MKKVTLLIVVFISFAKSYSQEIYLKTGRNFTSYAYRGDKEYDFKTSVGNSFEIGHSKHFKNVYCYTLGLTLNEYNAITKQGSSIFTSFNTQYLGIQNSIQLRVFKIKFVEVDAKAGINMATILYGKIIQNESGISTVDDLNKAEAFKGLVFQPVLGVEAKLKLTPQGYLSVGYNRTNSYNLSNTKRIEDYKFKTDQISFGVHFQK
jgi:hypothetical protein